MTVRIYLASTPAALVALRSQPGLPAGSRAHAVTRLLRTAWPDGSPEEWEYAALAAAAEESRGSSRPGDLPRRVVVAADVDEVIWAEDPDEEVTAVRVGTPVRWGQVAAVLVDDRDDAADDLAWFARQEVDALVDGWRTRLGTG